MGIAFDSLWLVPCVCPYTFFVFTSSKELFWFDITLLRFVALVYNFSCVCLVRNCLVHWCIFGLVKLWSLWKPIVLMIFRWSVVRCIAYNDSSPGLEAIIVEFRSRLLDMDPSRSSGKLRLENSTVMFIQSTALLSSFGVRLSLTPSNEWLKHQHFVDS